MGYFQAPLRGYLLNWGARAWLLLLAFSAAAQTNAPEVRIPKLAPVRAELQPTFWERYELWVILGGLFLLALIGLGVWLLLRPKPPVVTPPAQEARVALAPLARQPEDGLLLSRVSQVLRHYFVAAFSLPQGERTTAEFCRLIIFREDIGAPLSVPVTEFLRQCDERKFAPQPPDAPLAAVARALKLIEQAEARRTALAQAARLQSNAK